MSKSVLCADKEKENKCGAMEQTYTRFILLGSVMSKSVLCVLIKKKMVNVELWSSHILGSYVTNLLYTARFSNVECVLCVNKEKDSECGAMEWPRTVTRFMRDRRPAYCYDQ